MDSRNLTLPLPSNRRLEWADRWGAGPDEWAILSPEDMGEVRETEKAPGWFMDYCEKWPEEDEEEDAPDEPVDFYFAGWHDREQGVAKYDRGYGFCWHSCGGMDRFYVREVPGPLVFICVLSVDHALHTFDAVFTTLAGRQILTVTQKMLPTLLTMGDLIAMATNAAKADSLLRSQNQEVCVLLDGHAGATPLCPHAVLWSKHPPHVGLLQIG